jgi:hypothetical protein
MAERSAGQRLRRLQRVVRALPVGLAAQRSQRRLLAVAALLRTRRKLRTGALDNQKVCVYRSLSVVGVGSER